MRGIEDKILGLYATGMTTRDISEQIRELYGIDISAETVSNITNRILPLVSEWQNRPLESAYSFVFMDAIHYKVREDKQIIVKAAYVVIGVNLDGEKEVLGIWIGANESSKFWLSVLNDLKNIYPNDDIHVAIMFGTNEDHIYLTSLDGIITYDVFAN